MTLDASFRISAAGSNFRATTDMLIASSSEILAVSASHMGIDEASIQIPRVESPAKQSIATKALDQA